jgi:hypothetical protein
VIVKRGGRGFGSRRCFRTCLSPSASVDLLHLSRGLSRAVRAIFRTCLEPEAEEDLRPGFVTSWADATLRSDIYSGSSLAGTSHELNIRRTPPFTIPSVGDGPALRPAIGVVRGSRVAARLNTPRFNSVGPTLAYFDARAVTPPAGRAGR